MEFDYEEALKRQNCKDSDVQSLREKIGRFRHVPQSLSSKKVSEGKSFQGLITEWSKIILSFEQLLCFLNACNGIDDAANVISTYYDIRQSCAAIFSNRDPLSAEIQQCLANQSYFHLPNTPTGYSVFYHRLSNPKASNYMFNEACKTFFMTIGKSDSKIYFNCVRRDIMSYT